MSDDAPQNLLEIFRDGRVIDEALKEAVYQALQRHMQLGQSVVEWDGTKAVRLSPEEIGVRLKQMRTG